MKLSARQNARLRQRLALLCGQQGLTGRALAAKAGLSIGTVRSVGRTSSGPTLGTLLALAKALGVSSLDQLLGPSGMHLLRNLDQLEHDAGEATVTLVMGCDTAETPR